MKTWTSAGQDPRRPGAQGLHRGCWARCARQTALGPGREGGRAGGREEPRDRRGPARAERDQYEVIARRSRSSSRRRAWPSASSRLSAPRTSTRPSGHFDRSLGDNLTPGSRLQIGPPPARGLHRVPIEPRRRWPGIPLPARAGHGAQRGRAEQGQREVRQEPAPAPVRRRGRIYDPGKRGASGLVRRRQVVEVVPDPARALASRLRRVETCIRRGVPPGPDGTSATAWATGRFERGASPSAVWSPFRSATSGRAPRRARPPSVRRSQTRLSACARNHPRGARDGRNLIVPGGHRAAQRRQDRHRAAARRAHPAEHGESTPSTCFRREEDLVRPRAG